MNKLSTLSTNSLLGVTFQDLVPSKIFLQFLQVVQVLSCRNVHLSTEALLEGTLRLHLERTENNSLEKLSKIFP